MYIKFGTLLTRVLLVSCLKERTEIVSFCVCGTKSFQLPNPRDDHEDSPLLLFSLVLPRCLLLRLQLCLCNFIFLPRPWPKVTVDKRCCSVSRRTRSSFPSNDDILLGVRLRCHTTRFRVFVCRRGGTSPTPIPSDTSCTLSFTLPKAWKASVFETRCLTSVG